MIEPRYQSATRRREARRMIRRVLGSSKDSAPNAAQAVQAANWMIDLMSAATGGRIQLKMFDAAGNPLTLTTAMQVECGERS